MLDSFFLVVAAKSLLDKISSKQILKRKVVENGWDHPEWNKARQEMLFDKYLWNVGTCPEQEFMTTWELYQFAQKQLNDMGYVWNPIWDRYTPKKGMVEYVRGTQIYNNLFNSEYHRYGEDLELQDKLFMEIIIGNDMSSKDYFRFGGYNGTTQYQAYKLLKLEINGDFFNNGVFGPRYKEPTWNPKYESEYEPGRKSFTSWSVRDIGGLHNAFGEPFRWYDDLMPFTPSKNFLVSIDQETYNKCLLKGINPAEIQKKMRESVIGTYSQRKRNLQARNEQMKQNADRK